MFACVPFFILCRSVSCSISTLLMYIISRVYPYLEVGRKVFEVSGKPGVEKR